MATRGNIRDAIYDELSTLATSFSVTDADGNQVDTVTLDAENIGLRHPEGDEQLPQIVYHEDYRRREYNGVGSGADQVTYNNDGSVAAEVWREYIEGQFILDVRASTESVKEPIYEALRKTFARYQFPPWDITSLHPDIIDIDVRDTTSRDTGDTEQVIRGDQVEVRVTFYREYELSEDNIETIDFDYDVDGDDTTDFEYTIN
jgi:hypothetical protein